MVLDYRIPDELKKSYKEKLGKEKEKLNPESQKFIEDVLKGNVKTGRYEHETFAILEMKKKIKNIENVTFEEIYPEEIYPALDLMIVKKFR